MTPAPSLRHAKPLPCGCSNPPPGVRVKCPEAEALWAEVRALGAAANSTTEQWKRYRAHFRRTSKR